MEESKQQSVKLWDAVPGFDFIEEVDIPEMNSWFHDGEHSVPPFTPLFAWHWLRGVGHGTKFACAELSIPACKGHELRYFNGSSYAAWHIVKDKKEIAAREIKFREALIPWIDDFDSLWEADKEELLRIYGKLKELDVDNATNSQLLHHNFDLISACTRMWEIHFMGMYASYNAWIVLEKISKERFGISDHDPRFQDMMRGFPNKVYEMDKQLWEFGQLATNMQIDGIFKENEGQAIIASLKHTAKGSEWLKQFMNYLETDEIGGWRMRRFVDFTEPYWLEDPATPINLVRDYVVRGVEYDLEANRARLAKKREVAIAAYLSKVPPNEKDVFEGLIRLAGKASSYSEEHDLYCELIAHSLMRRGYLAMGKRMAENGTIDKPEDVFFLNPEEIDRVMMLPESYDMRWITRRRKATWEDSQTIPRPPVFTNRANFEEAVQLDLLPAEDAIAIKLIVGDLPEVIPQLNADMFGVCGCSGEAEGIARVINKYDDLQYVQQGDILVCPSTNPAWTPIFGIVNGVITDRGGTLSHAAIIGREYAVPTIVNTFEATSRIKSGQRVRMDASQGAVYILSK